MGFGRLTAAVEARWHPGAGSSSVWQRVLGVGALAILVVPLSWAAHVLTAGHPLGWVLDVTILYFAIGGASLSEHAMQVHEALTRPDVANARALLARIVSRDTAALDESEISAATVESVLENGCDAIFGALFWFIVAGAGGAVAYRLVNTLDAMWGYRTERYADFGWASAKLDDVLNWAPARLTALSYSLLGRSGDAIACWRRQGSTWKSPNAGPVMASGAGALGVRLGGPACYHGKLQQRPELGLGSAPSASDIPRSLRLVKRAQALWLAVIVALALAHVLQGGLWTALR